MSRLFSWLAEFFAKRSKKPWARFITIGIDDENQVRFEMAWNKAFLRNLKKNGFEADSDEEAVQDFLFGSLLLPKELFDEDEEEVQSSEHPSLQSEKNQYKRG